MTQRTPPAPEAILVPVALLILAMVGFQSGAALAKTLIPVVGAAGAVALRLGLATLMLLLVWRPWRARLSRHAPSSSTVRRSAA
jgi:inner membrane transporter RhtA